MGEGAGVGDGVGEGCGDGRGGTGDGAGGCGLGKVGPGLGLGGSLVTSMVAELVPISIPASTTFNKKRIVSSFGHDESHQIHVGVATGRIPND